MSDRLGMHLTSHPGLERVTVDHVVAGDGTLRANPGAISTVFDMGPVPDGADRIIGGGGPLTVRYSERTRPVNVTLNFGGADDGQQGERDEIIGGHELVSGGQAGDTIRAPAGLTAEHSLSGRAGNDAIDDADGPDTLSGGDGQDTINALGGADLIRANDGESDTVGCGSGTDTAELDSRDGFNGCENRGVGVGVLRLAPKALRAKAGEPVRLRLSWRHPRSWRRLHRIELRLVHQDVAVGTVTIRRHGPRVRAHGALQLVRRASRITRRGKTVSARLALRVGRSLAGRRLRVDVEAVDAGGARQLEHGAGSIRITG